MRRGLALVPLCALLAGCGGIGIAVPSHQDLRTPLDRAAQAGDVAEVQTLLASGADPNDRGSPSGSPLNFATAHDHNDDVIHVLIAAGANPNGRGAEGNTCWSSPLLGAASMGDLENTRALLDSGAAVRVGAPKSRCPKLVVGWLKPPVIELLVEHGLDLFAIDELGRNDLHLALAPPVTGNIEGIEYLVRAGVPLNARDHQGKTPLSYWREPRDFETHWFVIWLFEKLSRDGELPRQRETRAKISSLLELSGAQL
jgi:ankyrin repeat protein